MINGAYTNMRKEGWDALPILAQRIRILLERDSITANQLGEKTGISSSVIKSYLEKRIDIGADNLQKLADAFGVSTDYLLGRTKFQTVKASKKAAMKTTGLSEAAVTRLNKAKSDWAKSFEMPELNALLISDEFWTMLYYLSLYRYHCGVKENRPAMIKAAEARGDNEAIQRHKKDLNFSVTDKEVCWAGMFKALVKIAENIEKEAQ